MKTQYMPKIMLSISMIIFGTLGLFKRNIALGSGELALYRAILAVLLILIYLLVTKQKINLNLIKKEIPLLIISGIAIGVNWILLFEAYNHTTVSSATLSYYFAPVIVTVLCPVIFREKLTFKQLICFFMSTIGLIMIIGVENIGSDDFVGILFGLGAASFYAGVIILNKFIKNTKGMHRTLLQFVAAVIVLMPYVGFTSGTNLGALNAVGWVCLLTVGIVHTGITYCLYFSALKELKGQKTAILSYIDPLVAVLVSTLILRESITVLQIIGGMLILGFTLWNELSSK